MISLKYPNSLRLLLKLTKMRNSDLKRGTPNVPIDNKSKKGCKNKNRNTLKVPIPTKQLYKL